MGALYIEALYIYIAALCIGPCIYIGPPHIAALRIDLKNRVYDAPREALRLAAVSVP